MLKSIKVTIETDGQVHLKEPVRLTHVCRAIASIIDETDIAETTLLSEESLAEDWNRPEEEEAWSYLQQAQ